MHFDLSARKEDVQTRSAPTPAMTLRASVTWKAPERAPPTTHRVVHGARPEVTLRAGPASLALEARLASGPRPWLNDGGASSFDLVAETPYALLEGFEKRRGDVVPIQIEVRVFLTTSLAFLLPDQPMDGANVYSSTAPELSTIGTAVELSRDEWNHHLSNVGFADVLVFDLPILRIGATRDPRIEGALNSLALARRALHEQQTGYQAIVADHTYRAVQALVTGHPERIGDAIVDTYFGNANQDIRERMRKAVVALLSTHHVARKTPTDPGLEISRDHAKWILGTASLLIGWCAAQARV